MGSPFKLPVALLSRDKKGHGLRSMAFFIGESAMLSKQLADIGERIKRNGIDLKGALSVLQLGTIKAINAWLERQFNSRFRQEIEELTYFIPWNIEKNFPGIHVDTTGISIDYLWIS